MKITPVRGDDGALTDWIAVVDDVTERLDALDRLALAEARYRELVEYVPAVAYVAEWDEHSTLTYVWPQIEDMLGWPPQAFLDDQDLWYRCIHPEDLARVREHEARSYAEGSRVDMEFRMLRRDGAELWVRDKETVIHDAEGAPAFSQGVLVDVTPTRATEGESPPTSATARSATSTSPARSSSCWTPTARITLLNRAGAELLGYCRGRAGRPRLVRGGRPRAPARRRPRRLRRGGRRRRRRRRPRVGRRAPSDGDERTIAWRDTIVRDAGGAVDRHDVERAST